MRRVNGGILCRPCLFDCLSVFCLFVCRLFVCLWEVSMAAFTALFYYTNSLPPMFVWLFVCFLFVYLSFVCLSFVCLFVYLWEVSMVAFTALFHFTQILCKFFYYTNFYTNSSPPMALISFGNCAFFTVVELVNHDPVKTANKLDY